MIQLTRAYLASADSPIWHRWGEEIRYSHGWSEFTASPLASVYASIVRDAYLPLPVTSQASISIRLSAMEHILDLVPVEDSREFGERLNGRARWFGVGLRLEGRRFVPIATEHLHSEIVKPTLALLYDPRLVDVDTLYRKAFERALSNDPSGAVTAAQSAIEEMLRTGLGVKSGKLDSLAKRAREKGWLSPSAYQVAVKLGAMRPDSDAHQPGTSEFEDAMFALHLTGSVLLRLGRSAPFLER